MPSDRPSKTCPTCERPFAWRRRWARCWDRVVYCSERCRRRARSDRAQPNVEDPAATAILDLLARRDASSTICPSEAARALEPTDWRAEMDRVRETARGLATRGIVVFRQRGAVVDPATARGALRLGRGPRFETLRPRT